MEPEKKKVIKAYLKKIIGKKHALGIFGRYVTLVKELPLNTLLILEEYSGRSYILKIRYFRRREFRYCADIYALNPAYPNEFDYCTWNKSPLLQLEADLHQIKSWKLWTPSFAPLTINYIMSDWYKTMAFRK